MLRRRRLRRRPGPLLYYNLLLEVLAWVRVAKLAAGLNLISQRVANACQHLRHWRRAIRPRTVQALWFFVSHSY
jgi:hypothetical protein